MSGARDEDLHRLGKEMLDTDDQRLMRIVQVVDALPERGQADGLIAPLRPRLAVLRPARPLTLTRLLFMPLDPLVIAPAQWQPGALGIPRTALQPLGAAVAQALGAVAKHVQDRVAGHDSRDTAAAADAGDALWPAAAEALRQGRVPGGWSAPAGIPAEEASALGRAIATLLAHGAALHGLAVQPEAAADMRQAEALLTAAAHESAAALEMMLVLLLAQTLEAGSLLRLAEDLAKRFGRAPPDRALDFLLGPFSDTQGAAEGATPGSSAIRRAAILLDGMERRPAMRQPQVEKVDRLRRRLDGACRARFELAAERLQRMAPAGGRGGPADDGEVNGIEAAALDLRRLEAVGRRVGGADFDDAALRLAAERLVAAPGLTPVDRVRLAEILLGPEAALALMEQRGFPAGT